MTCDESAPYCVQCGSRGWGAALCLSSPDLGDRDCGGEEPEEITVTEGAVVGEFMEEITVTEATEFVVETDTVCDVGAACSEEGSTCNNGKTETCCGETFISFECDCSNGEYLCRYTDACMHPVCETETPSTVVVAGIVEGGDPSPVEVLVDEGDPSITTVEPDVSVDQTSAVEPDGMDQTTTDAPTPANTVSVGGYDEYGCSPSAGYTWCLELSECIQGFTTPCPVVGTNFVGPVLLSCSDGRCNLEPNDCLIDMGSWTATGPYMNGLDGKYPIPDGCTATCDDGCDAVADGDFNFDGVDEDGPLFQTEADDSSAYGLCALRMVAVSMMLSIGVSMMLA